MVGIPSPCVENNLEVCPHGVCLTKLETGHPSLKEIHGARKLYDTTKRSLMWSDVTAPNDPGITELRDKAIRFLQGTPEGDHPQTEYEGLIRLSLMFLEVDDGKPLRQRGAFHHVR